MMESQQDSCGQVRATTPTTALTLDFGPELLLPVIEQTLYSFTASDGSSPFARHYATTNGTTVTVHFETAVAGSVTMEAAQAVDGMPPPARHA